MRVGFVGLGRMGRLMARNQITAGDDVLVWARNLETQLQFSVATGVSCANTPADLAGQTQAVITMLADDTASRVAYLKPEGLFATQAGADIFIEMSTVSSTHLAKVQAHAGSRILFYAPVSGATQAGKNATLIIMAGAA